MVCEGTLAYPLPIATIWRLRGGGSECDCGVSDAAVVIYGGWLYKFGSDARVIEVEEVEQDDEQFVEIPEFLRQLHRIEQLHQPGHRYRHPRRRHQYH